MSLQFTERDPECRSLPPHECVENWSIKWKCQKERYWTQQCSHNQDNPPPFPTTLPSVKIPFGPRPHLPTLVTDPLTIATDVSNDYKHREGKKEKRRDQTPFAMFLAGPESMVIRVWVDRSLLPLLRVLVLWARGGLVSLLLVSALTDEQSNPVTSSPNLSDPSQGTRKKSDDRRRPSLATHQSYTTSHNRESRSVGRRGRRVGLGSESLSSRPECVGRDEGLLPSTHNSSSLSGMDRWQSTVWMLRKGSEDFSVGESDPTRIHYPHSQVCV